MPFKDPNLSLRDIRDGIDMIVQFVHGMDFEAFREDPKTVAAVERKLLLVSEAAVRLGEDAERLCPGLPWQNIRGIGNWLRHRYDRVDVETVWNTVVDDLPPLRSGVLRALTPLRTALEPAAVYNDTDPFPMTRRVNIALPEATRQSVRTLRTRVEQAAVRDRALDREVGAEWLEVDQETSRHLDEGEAGRTPVPPGAAKPTSRRSIRR